MNRIWIGIAGIAALGITAIALRGPSRPTAVGDTVLQADAALDGVNTSGPPRLLLVGIDRSASLSSQQQRDVRGFMTGLAQNLRFGDEILIATIMQEGTDSIREWRTSVPIPRSADRPSSREKRALETAQRSVVSTSQIFTDTVGMGDINSTDILQTLARFSNYVRSAESRPVVLILLSDMLHSTSALNMERRERIPDAAWVERQRTGSLIPALEGACIVAVGVEDGTPRGVAAQRFWQAYFTAAGATLREDHYRRTMPASDIRC